jgi:DNA-binding MarR family transcriptional regulator
MRSTEKQFKEASVKTGAQIGFLLAQIGAHATNRFSERIRPLGLTPAHAGMMRLIARFPGLSQRDLCARLSILPSRLVLLVDELEEKGFVERRDDPSDRRSYDLHLTQKGQKAMETLGRLAKEHGNEMCEGLTSEERMTLAELISKIADAQGLTPGVHPGYKRMGKPEG